MKDKQIFSLPYRVAQTANKINQSLSKALKEFDIATEQRAILYNIEKDPMISQNKLSQNLGKDKTTISRTLDALEKRGYISRKSTDDDRRIKIINLTPSGIEVLKKTEPVVSRFRSEVMIGFKKEEIDIMFNLIEKLSNNIDRYNSEE